MTKRQDMTGGQAGPGGGDGRFADLLPRILSAVVMIVVGLSALVAGGMWFAALLVVLAGLMLWELARMLSPGDGIGPVGLGLVGAGSVLWVALAITPLSALALALAPVLGLALLPRDRGIFLAYGLAIVTAAAVLIALRLRGGLDWTLWLVLVVIASDVGGYLFGRLLGGPKILPRISPKKTWSGTLGGWLLAALVGVMFQRLYPSLGWWPPVLSVMAAVAAQAGDVVESAIKRHAGVKDSSALIPGHGGLLDRFDGMIGAALFLLVAAVVRVGVIG